MLDDRIIHKAHIRDFMDGSGGSGRWPIGDGTFRLGIGLLDTIGTTVPARSILR